MLREADYEILRSFGFVYDTYPSGSTTLLVIRDYPLPDGYTPARSDVLVLVPDAYPDAPLDMWWMFPWVRFNATGAYPQAATVSQAFSDYQLEPGRSWQRFSRHPSWRPGVDDLRTFLRWMQFHLEDDLRVLRAA